MRECSPSAKAGESHGRDDGLRNGLTLMWSYRLLWIFGALFILSGLPMLIVDSVETQRRFAGLSMLSLGGFAVALAYNAVRSGRITLQNSTITRRAQPRMFWSAVGSVALAGAIVIIGAVWLSLGNN